jgi:F-type H+-transporting ATPase subunit b
MIAFLRGRPRAAPIGPTLTLAAGLVILLAPWAAGVAWAAEGGSDDPWRDLLWRAVNLGTLLVLLYLFARKPIAGLFGGAARAARAELDAQREDARRAEAELAEQRRRIEGLQAELERMAAEAREEARSEHERLLAEARRQAERIRGAVRLQVEHEFSKASKALQVELARETVRLAESLIQGRMDDAGRSRLTTQAIERLGAGA